MRQSLLIKLTIIVVVLMCSHLWAHESIGLSMSSDVEDDDSQIRQFEVNYETKSRFVSAYVGYAWLDVPAAYDSSLAIDGVVETQGFHGAFLFHLDHHLFQPYVGFGAYGGYVDVCAEGFSTGRCKREETYAFYPEVGFRVNLGRHFVLSAKVRRYDFDRREIRDETVTLFSIGYFY